MSGFEVAGIVLATFPLVISALEHYANGVIKINNFRRYERELKSLQRDLAIEQELLSGSIRLLLRTIVASEHELERLINEPGGMSWNEESFKEKLEAKLQKSHQVYMDKLEDMNEAMLDLTKRLGLKPSGQLPSADVKVVRSYLKRMKFTLTRSHYTDIMDRIKADNMALGRLTQQRNELEMPRRQRNCQFESSFFERLRRSAKNVFETLAASLACTCPEPHQVNLELLHRKGKPMMHGEIRSADMDLKFAALISYKGGPTNLGQSSLYWKEIEIGMADESPGRPALGTTPIIPVRSASNETVLPIHGGLQSNNKKTKIQKWKGKSVKWDNGISAAVASSSALAVPAVGIPRTISSSAVLDLAPDSLQHSAVTTTTVADSSKLCAPDLLVPRSAPLLEITYLCGELQKPNIRCRKQSCLISWAKDSVTGDSWSPIPLRTILKGKPTNLPEFYWADRLATAVALSSSVLQLPECTWLDPKWLKNDVVFVGGRSGKPYQHLFLAKKFATKCSTLTQTGNRAQDIVPWIRNPTVFALGVLLIELCFGNSIGDLRTNDPLSADGLVDDLTCFSIARRLLDDSIIYSEKGPQYEEAVRRCIYCEFDQRRNTMEENEFRRAFYEKVVTLLEEVLVQFSHS